MSAKSEGLVLTNVRAGYGETVVIDDVSLSLAPGATLALLGRNGVGKTTLFSTIMGHTTMHGGSIRFNGEEIGKLPPYRRALMGLALVPQEREIFPSLSVRENMDVAARPGPSMTTKRISPPSAFLSTRISALQRSIGIGGACTGRPARWHRRCRRGTKAASTRPSRADNSAASTMPQPTASPCSQAP
jgi:ABC-type sugar transport system ATPase subunit